MADTALGVLSLAITSAISFAVGFRLHGGPAGALAAFGLLVVFGFAFEWMFITLGLVARTPPGRPGPGPDGVPAHLRALATARYRRG